MYNTKVICTYNTPEVFLDTDNITNREKEFIRDTIYRQEILDIFELEEYDENELNKIIFELYDKLKNCDDLQHCIKKIAEKILYANNNLGFVLLFSYDYMYLTHICISEFIENGKISEENIKKLEDAIY
jgi:hypothetical protein